ncbi:MAG TPA: TonB-dependent receptor plug domain-containing protein [Candidatus Acidoferrales bacterium]|nr:TonB-dependent receptor plug domain-containing protein [Candidatus Acidoferrales bacterium]
MIANRKRLTPLLDVLALASHLPGAEETVPTASLTLPEVSVEGASEAPSIPLEAAETPNAVEVLTQERPQREGAPTLIEAYRSSADVSAGNLPGESGAATLRGFSRAATGYMIDGVHAIDSLLRSRDYDTWNVERIGIMKGPASVMHGVGSLAGAINLVTKKPLLEASSEEALLSYGSFDSWRAAVGGGDRLLSDCVAVRADTVVGPSGGHVDDTNSRTGALATGIVIKANDRLTLSAAADYFYDRFTMPYHVPAAARRCTFAIKRGVCARRPRHRPCSASDHYNVTDGRMDSDTASGCAPTPNIASTRTGSWSTNSVISMPSASGPTRKTSPTRRAASCWIALQPRSPTALAHSDHSTRRLAPLLDIHHEDLRHDPSSSSRLSTDHGRHRCRIGASRRIRRHPHARRSLGERRRARSALDPRHFHLGRSHGG